MNIEQDILYVLLTHFPGADIFQEYDQFSGLYTFKVIITLKTPDFQVKLPSGFLVTEFHAHARQLIFTALIHREVFIETYYKNIEITEKCYA